jgi:ABC-type molybdate transport system substrate-binding protein
MMRSVGRVPHRTEPTLEQVSIRGRMAYAAACIEAAIAELWQASSTTNECVRVLWEFCAAEDLSEWERTAMDVIGSALDNGTIAEETGSAVAQEAIEAAFEDVGRGNLYAGVVGRSDATLKGAVRVATLVEQLGVSLPDPSRYLGSSFDEEHGWGRPWRRGLRFDL